MTLPVIVPVLFWAAYHYHKDRHLPEPLDKLLLSFAFGVAASFIAQWLYQGLGIVGLRFDALTLAQSNPVGLFFYSMFAIGPIEEFSKLLPFVVLVLRFRAFDEPIDGIIYASFIGLGFAAAENFHYLRFLTPLESIARGFAGPVVHIVFASIWGHWIGLAYLGGRSIIGCSVAGFAIAAGLHGVYDFIVLLDPRHSLPIAAALILAIWVWRLKIMHLLHLDAVAASDAAVKRE